MGRLTGLVLLNGGSLGSGARLSLPLCAAMVLGTDSKGWMNYLACGRERSTR